MEIQITTDTQTVPSKDKFIPLWEKNEPFEVDCDIYFAEDFTKVDFYDDSFKMLNVKAAEIVRVSNFIIKQNLYVKTDPSMIVKDYFEIPFDKQPFGSYKGRVRLQLKWLVKSLNGYEVKPQVITFFVLFQY